MRNTTQDFKHAFAGKLPFSLYLYPSKTKSTDYKNVMALLPEHFVSYQALSFGLRLKKQLSSQLFTVFHHVSKELQHVHLEEALEQIHNTQKENLQQKSHLLGQNIQRDFSRMLDEYKVGYFVMSASMLNELKELDREDIFEVCKQKNCHLLLIPEADQELTF